MLNCQLVPNIMFSLREKQVGSKLLHKTSAECIKQHLKHFFSSQMLNPSLHPCCYLPSILKVVISKVWVDAPWWAVKELLVGYNNFEIKYVWLHIYINVFV